MLMLSGRDCSYCDEKAEGNGVRTDQMCNQKTSLRSDEAVQGLFPLRCFFPERQQLEKEQDEIHGDSISRSIWQPAKLRVTEEEEVHIKKK